VGRAFGVKGDKIPPSLINIKKEIKRSLNQDLMDYTLEKWQNQGVLLLNTILSVREGDPMSHSKMGWQDLTIDLLRKVIKINSDIVVVGLGNYAIKITEALEHELVINTSHPSPLSAYRGFNNSDIFQKINIILKEKNKEPILWGENVQE
jgi:uracil-DNA glycosylase